MALSDCQLHLNLQHEWLERDRRKAVPATDNLDLLMGANQSTRCDGTPTTAAHALAGSQPEPAHKAAHEAGTCAEAQWRIMQYCSELHEPCCDAILRKILDCSTRL